MNELVGHLRPTLGHLRAAAVTTGDVNRYVGRRQADDAANATINRELAALKRAYSLAYPGASRTLAERRRGIRTPPRGLYIVGDRAECNKQVGNLKLSADPADRCAGQYGYDKRHDAKDVLNGNQVLATPFR